MTSSQNSVVIEFCEDVMTKTVWGYICEQILLIHSQGSINNCVPYKWCWNKNHCNTKYIRIKYIANVPSEDILQISTKNAKQFVR